MATQTTAATDAFYQAARPDVRHLYRRLHRIHRPARDPRADGRSEQNPRLFLRVLHPRGLRHHRRRDAHGTDFRVLRRRPAGAGTSTTAWRPAPTGCRRPPSSAWPARCSCSATTALPGCSAGPAASCWCRSWSAPICASSAPIPCPTSCRSDTAATSPASSAVIVLVCCSFTYVTAQIYGTGLIASRFLGMQFEIAVFAGLVGILLCAMLGGMRAVTWTQIAQYIVLIVAYLTPIVILSTTAFRHSDPRTDLRKGDRGNHRPRAADW